MMPTGADVAVSESSKSRPASTGTPSVVKKSGPATLLRTVLDPPFATSGSFPSTVISLLSDDHDPSRHSISVTDSTPGSARSLLINSR